MRPYQGVLSGVRVLLVDDCKLVRATVAAMLEYFGAVVTVAGSADEALKAVECERPDVLLSHLAMPDKGGYWLIGQVRSLPLERGGATPAAALTGFTGPEHRASVLRAGFQHHIEKPVTLYNLAEIVSILVLNAQSQPHSVQEFHRSTAPNHAGLADGILVGAQGVFEAAPRPWAAYGRN